MSKQQAPPTPVSLPRRKRPRSPTSEVDEGGSSKRTKTTPSSDTTDIVPWPTSLQPRRPRLAVFDPQFGQAETLALQAPDEFLRAYENLKANGFFNAELETLAIELKNIRSFKERYPETLPTVLLGASNAGKSSAINSLLDETKAAIVSSADRGTHIVTFYLSALPTQSSKFLVETHYLTRDEIESTVISNLQIIFDYLSKRRERSSAGEESDEESEEDDDTICGDDADTEDANKRAERQLIGTAFQFFRAPLCGTPGFQTKESTIDYFASCVENPRAELVQRLADLLVGYKDLREVKPDDTETFTAEDNEQLAAILRDTCRPVDTLLGQAEHPHPWTLVSKCYVHLKNDLLDAGIILADSPGVTDSNTAVVGAAMNALRHSGKVLIFASAARIKDNIEVEKQLEYCIRADRMYDTHLVLSKVDEAAISELDRAGHSPAQVDCLRQAEVLLSELSFEKERVCGQFDKALQDGNSTDVLALGRKVEDLRSKLADAESDVELIGTKMYANKWKSEMRNRLRDITGIGTDPDLPVHCISNSRYRALVSLTEKGGLDQRRNERDLTASGIPELRAVLYRSATNGKLDILAALLRHDLSRVLDSAMATLNKSQISSKTAAALQLEDVYGESDGVILKQSGSFKRIFTEALRAAVDNNKKTWINSALDKLGRTKKTGSAKTNSNKADWRSYRHNTFQAFCHYEGQWTNPFTKKSSSWNEAIRDIMKNVMMPLFLQLESIVEYGAHLLEHRIKQRFQDLKDELRSPDALGNTPEARGFYTFLNGERDTLIKEVRRTYGIPEVASTSKSADKHQPMATSLTKKLRKVGQRIVVHPDSGYVLDAMKPTYKACDKIAKAESKTVSGKRKRTRKERISQHDQRVELMRSVFEGSDGQTNVFAAVSELAAKDLEAPVTAWEKSMERSFARSQARIVKEFGRRFKEVGEQQPTIGAPAVRALTMACGRAMDKRRAGMELVEELEEMEGADAAQWAEIGAA